jgi:hypothetical protein
MTAFANAGVGTGVGVASSGWGSSPSGSASQPWKTCRSMQWRLTTVGPSPSAYAGSSALRARETTSAHGWNHREGGPCGTKTLRSWKMEVPVDRRCSVATLGWVDSGCWYSRERRPFS